MEAFQEGALAFFSAVGMVTVVWLAAGALLFAGRPVIPELTLILPLRGAAPAMEQDVREVRRVLRQLPGARFVLADCGMTEDARELARYLAARTDGAEVVKAEDLQVG